MEAITFTPAQVHVFNHFRKPFSIVTCLLMVRLRYSFFMYHSRCFVHVLNRNLVRTYSRVSFRDVLECLSVLFFCLIIPVLFSATLLQEKFCHFLKRLLLQNYCCQPRGRSATTGDAFRAKRRKNAHEEYRIPLVALKAQKILRDINKINSSIS